MFPQTSFQPDHTLAVTKFESLSNCTIFLAIPDPDLSHHPAKSDGTEVPLHQAQVAHQHQGPGHVHAQGLAHVQGAQSPAAQDLEEKDALDPPPVLTPGLPGGSGLV